MSPRDEGEILENGDTTTAISWGIPAAKRTISLDWIPTQEINKIVLLNGVITI